MGNFYRLVLGPVTRADLGGIIDQPRVLLLEKRLIYTWRGGPFSGLFNSRSYLLHTYSICNRVVERKALLWEGLCMLELGVTWHLLRRYLEQLGRTSHVY